MSERDQQRAEQIAKFYARAACHQKSLADAIASALSHARKEAEEERDRETELRRKAESHARSLVAALEQKPYPDEYADIERRAKEAEAALLTLREALEEFTTWWRDHRDGSPNAAYARVDRFVAALTPPPPEVSRGV